MEIKYINESDLQTKVSNTCGKIAAIYGLQFPENGFISYLSATLKKLFGNLTMDHIESAFEYASFGYLNDYLPKSEGKIKFNIPDFVKVIKAYVKFKQLDKKEGELTKEPEESVKSQITKNWCNQIEGIFNTYLTKRERTHISLPFYTCEVFAKIGLIKPDQIDYSEKKINIRFNNSVYQTKSNNQDLIYNTFDDLIAYGESIGSYLKEHRERYMTVEEKFNL